MCAFPYYSLYMENMLKWNFKQKLLTDDNQWLDKQEREREEACFTFFFPSSPCLGQRVEVGVWGGKEGGWPFPGNKAELGQKPLMFILADGPPYPPHRLFGLLLCLSRYNNNQPTTHPPPPPAPWGALCAWPRVRGCPVLKPVTDKQPPFPSMFFHLYHLCFTFNLAFYLRCKTF